MAFEYEKLGVVEIEIPDFKNQTGEINGSFDESKLERYIKMYGSDKLVKSLVGMASKAIELENKIQRFHDSEDLKAGISVS